MYAPPPWPDGVLPCGPEVCHHLERVLRRAEASEVSYTDGMGTIGTGTYSDRCIVRGVERQAARLPAPAIAVAPTQSIERNRFIVEKCAELGVARLVWLTTHHGHGRPPRKEKSYAWNLAALQQSRGAHLMKIGESEQRIADLAGPIVVADPEGANATDLELTEPVTIVIGPEGGFSAGELPPRARRWKVSERVLRTETAAVVAAALGCEMMQRTRSEQQAIDVQGPA